MHYIFVASQMSAVNCMSDQLYSYDDDIDFYAIIIVVK